MAREDVNVVKKFLKAFPHDVREKALWIRDFIWKTYPHTNELIYDNYNAFAVGWSPTDRVGHTFVSFACGRSSHNVHFGFYYGSKLNDKKKLLIGEGNQYRYLLFKGQDEFPEKYALDLMKQAYEYSISLVKDQSQLKSGLTIFKSSSEKKRPNAKQKSKKP